VSAGVDGQDVGTFGAALVAFCGFLYQIVGFLESDVTTTVVGASVMLAGVASMMLVLHRPGRSRDAVLAP
jgi:hypothetical protein